MIQSPKVLWGEGLFLRPQHFQQQDAYHEWRLTQASRALHPHAWGVRHLKLDADALQTGVLRGNASEEADDSLDIKALLRVAAVWNIPVACNESSADYLLGSVLLDQAHDYRIPDYTAYLAARS